MQQKDHGGMERKVHKTGARPMYDDVCSGSLAYQMNTKEVKGKRNEDADIWCMKWHGKVKFGMKRLEKQLKKWKYRKKCHVSKENPLKSVAKSCKLEFEAMICGVHFLTYE